MANGTSRLVRMNAARAKARYEHDIQHVENLLAKVKHADAQANTRNTKRVVKTKVADTTWKKYLTKTTNLAAVRIFRSPAEARAAYLTALYNLDFMGS